MISIINNIDRHNSSVRINICFAHATADMIVATIGCPKRQIMCLTRPGILGRDTHSQPKKKRTKENCLNSELFSCLAIQT